MMDSTPQGEEQQQQHEDEELQLDGKHIVVVRFPTVSENVNSKTYAKYVTTATRFYRDCCIISVRRRGPYIGQCAEIYYYEEVGLRLAAAFCSSLAGVLSFFLSFSLFPFFPPRTDS